MTTDMKLIEFEVRVETGDIAVDKKICARDIDKTGYREHGMQIKLFSYHGLPVAKF